MDASRALKDGVLSEKAYEDGAREVVVMPSLSGPVSLVLGVRLLLLDREDYDDETLDAILRHELVHVYGQNTSCGACRGSCWARFLVRATMWLLRREARVREEYTCDREANLGRTMEERRAYAHAMASLAAPRRREAFGTANMACGEATLRRRVEAALSRGTGAALVAKGAAPPSGVRRARLRAARFAGAVLWPGLLRLDEGNLLNFVGHDILFELSEGMHPDSFPILRGEDYSFRRLETKTPPYGAAAVYNDRNDIYLSFPDDPPPRTRPARN